MMKSGTTNQSEETSVCHELCVLSQAIVREADFDPCKRGREDLSSCNQLPHTYYKSTGKIVGLF